MANSKGKKTLGSYFVSALSISLVLIVVGVLALVLLNAKQISDKVVQNIGFSIIVNEGVGNVEIKRLQKILETKPFVAETRLLSKEQAAEDFKNELGEDFVEVLGFNPLLASIDVKLIAAYANNDSLEVITQELLKDEMIYEVSYQKSLVEAINENVKRISMILLITSLVLVVISFTLIRNTIHLTIYAQRFLIKTMQLVGATPFFICRPFIKEGLWLGFFSGLFANTVLLVFVYLLQQEVGAVMNIVDVQVFVALIGFVMMCGILLSVISSWTSVAKYIRKDISDLYN